MSFNNVEGIFGRLLDFGLRALSAVRKMFDQTSTPEARPTSTTASRSTSTTASRSTSTPTSRPTTPALRPTTPALRPTSTTASRPTSTSASLGTLPTEILLRIESYIASQRDCVSLSRVDRLFNNIFTDLLLRRNNSENENSALLWAAENRNMVVLKHMLSLGINTDSIFSIRALSVAIDTNDMEMINALLDAGINPLSRDPFQRSLQFWAEDLTFSPLNVAFKNRNEQLVMALTDYHFKRDKPQDPSPLVYIHKALDNNMVRTIRSFLDNGGVDWVENWMRDFLLSYEPPFPGQQIPNRLIKNMELLFRFGVEADPFVLDHASRHSDERIRRLFARQALVQAGKDKWEPVKDIAPLIEGRQGMRICRFFEKGSDGVDLIDSDGGYHSFRHL